MALNRESSPSSQKPSLLLDLLDFLSFILDAVSLSQLFHQKNYSESTDPPQHNARHETDCYKHSAFRPLRVVIESTPPPPPPTEEQKAKDRSAERQRENAEIREGRKLVAEIFLACFTALLLVANVWLVLTTRRANRLSGISIQNAKENFTTEQQPVIWVTPKMPSYGLNKRLEWNFEYSNYGRSPALNLHLCAHPIIGSAAFSVAQASPPSMVSCERQLGSASVVPPAYPGFITISSDEALTQPDLNAIENINGGLVAVGIFEYSDASGHSYVSTFCSYRLKGGALAHCPKYNEYNRIN